MRTFITFIFTRNSIHILFFIYRNYLAVVLLILPTKQPHSYIL